MSSSTGKRQRRRVVWDEDNLAHLEETKTPKQKITEPKTPYHTLSLDPDEAKALSPMQLPNSDTEAAAGPQLNPEQVRDALTEVAAHSRGRGRGGGWTSSEDEGDAGEFEKWMEDRAAAAAAAGDQEGPSVSFHGSEDYYGSSSAKGKINEKAFKEHRRRHYDEFRKLKQLRAQGKRDIEGDDADNEVAESHRQGSSSGGEQGYLGGAESDGEAKKGAKGPLAAAEDGSESAKSLDSGSESAPEGMAEDGSAPLETDQSKA